MNPNIPPKSSIITADNKVRHKGLIIKNTSTNETMQITSTTTHGTKKRAAPDQLEGQAKKMMVDHSSSEERIPRVVPKSALQPKFVSAADVAANVRKNIQVMPEISDEELLEMALKFEMEHPE